MWNRREEIIVLGSFALSPARNQMTSHLLLPEDKDSMSLQNSANICVNTENNNTNVFTATRTSVTVSTTDVWSCLVPPLSRLVLNVNTNILLCSVIDRDGPSGDVNLSRCLGQTETITLSLKKPAWRVVYGSPEKWNKRFQFTRNSIHHGPGDVLSEFEIRGRNARGKNLLAITSHSRVTLLYRVS